MNIHVPSLKRRLTNIVAEYEHKLAALPDEVERFKTAGRKLKMAATIGGTYGKVDIDTGRIYDDSLRDSLLKSAWQHVYDGLNINVLASPNDKQRFKMAMEAPPPFTIDNIGATFGRYVEDPEASILRSLAEVFCDLDPVYKSHNNVKFGTKRLPKRIIIGNMSTYGLGKDRLEAVLNALAAYQGKPLVTWREIKALLDDECALLTSGVLPAEQYVSEPMPIVGRGVRLRCHKNGNGHLFFEPDTLRDINMALAKFYGNVLPDTPDEATTKQAGTAVAKDLQFYWTPDATVKRVLADIHPLEGQRVLEPSCGDGRFLDALRAKGASVFGIEVDPRRAAICRAKGHTVLGINFLETVPVEDFDLVVMNPPFYGTHHVKHVLHALKFLKPGGKLIAILPASARYDHKLLDGRWEDLPVGSFLESGTGINTTVLTMFRKESD